ncbi:MAG: DUF3014 domain-containing protein [Porticoccaceae bacterium]|nr:DUF3014 domain-containing protein [Porticoccaceae bacterium]
MNLRAEREDRLGGRNQKKGRWPLIAIIVIIAAVAVWFIAKPGDPEPPPVVIPDAPAPLPPAVEEEDPLISAAPSIPEREPEPQPALEDEEQPAAPEPLPPLEDSDNFTRDLLATHSDSDILANWLTSDSLLPKAVALIDNLAKGEIARKVLPTQAPEDPFKVVMEQDIAWLDESNFARYDTYVDAVTSIPPQTLANSFHTLRPLLETAYGELGRSGAGLDQRIIAAIDRMLLTPDHNGPFALERESVFYQFADPSLEALPSVQKQLLRIGPENRARIKNYLKELRVALLEGAPQQ